MYFGAHVSSGGGIDKTLDRAEAMGADCVQLFTQSPRMWRPTNHKPEALERFRERRAELGVPVGGVVAHALYLINLASEKFLEQSVAALRNTLEVVTAIGGDGVVFHVGSHLGEGMDAGMAHVVDGINRALELTSDSVWLLMEDSAGAGGTIGRSVDELAQLFDACGRHPRLGICLDTCHLYVSGVDITHRSTVDALLDEVDEKIGLDRLRALHVNDARDPLGSNRDRHANIGEGVLSEELGVFVSHPRLQGLPAFLEVPGPDKHGPNADELAKVRDIHARWAATAG